MRTTAAAASDLDAVMARTLVPGLRHSSPTSIAAGRRRGSEIFLVDRDRSPTGGPPQCGKNRMKPSACRKYPSRGCGGRTENGMAINQTAQIIQRLPRAVLGREDAESTDSQLLERFIGDREEAAFESLVLRHGPMVMGVCRRLLRNA